MTRLQRIVKRHGYRAYLALKIGKLVMFPVIVVLWLALAALLFPVFVIGGALDGFETFLEGASDVVVESILSKKWFTGFSRRYFATLKMYKPAPVALPPEDIVS